MILQSIKYTNFGDAIRNHKSRKDMADDEQDQLEHKIREFTTNTRTRSFNLKKKVFKILFCHFSKEKKW